PACRSHPRGPFLPPGPKKTLLKISPTSGPPSPSPSLLPKSPSRRAFGLPFLCPLRPKVKAAACRCPLLRQFRSTCAPPARPSSWLASRKDWFWFWLWILRFPNRLAEVLAGARLLVWAAARGDSAAGEGLHRKDPVRGGWSDAAGVLDKVLACLI
uniref:Uncharacterized protein n=1 Tax=Triticum urartu TaxID=4572 RepID=A0A8R7P1C8_TRIUA